ncbi:hypothetical protein LCGC14_2335720, partial [marine sediment metagenome]
MSQAKETKAYNAARRRKTVATGELIDKCLKSCRPIDKEKVDSGIEKYGISRWKYDKLSSMICDDGGELAGLNQEDLAKWFVHEHNCLCDIIDSQAGQIEAKDELIGWVWKTSVTLFEAKDRCK